MERRVSVRVLLLSFVLLLALAVQECRAELAVVLVIDKNSPVNSISTLDIRKAYLGITVVVDGQIIRPLRSRHDDRLNQIFLQSIVAMSQRSYDRRLLSLLLKNGKPRPVEVDGHDKLLEMLTRRPSSIAYMWKSDADLDERIKIIKVLWRET